MSVLIKGLKMPNGCLSCPLASGYYIEDTEKDEWVNVRCRVLNKKMQVHGVPNDCPLVAIPDHGRLIDEDDVIAEAKSGEYWWETEEEVPGILKEIPTIIPAERSKE